MRSLAFSFATYGAAIVLTLGVVQPVAAQSSAAIGAQASAQQWNFQVDTPTLNSTLNSWAASQGGLRTPFGTARLRNLTADIGNGQLMVRGTADAGWFSMPVDAAATASVQGGNLRVQVIQARINGIGVPDAARNEMEQQLQAQIAQSIAASGVVVRSVSLTSGKLVVDGTRP